MGFLLERLASHPRVSMPRAALAQIERDACRRLNVPLSSPSLESLEIEVSHFGGRARDGGAVLNLPSQKKIVLAIVLKICTLEASIIFPGLHLIGDLGRGFWVCSQNNIS